MSDEKLIQAILDEKIFKNVAAIATSLGHKSPSHLYRVRKGDGNLSERDRKALEAHRDRQAQPSPVFSPKILDAQPDLKWLCLESGNGQEVRIPLNLREGRWVITSPAFDIFVERTG